MLEMKKVQIYSFNHLSLKNSHIKRYNMFNIDLQDYAYLHNWTYCKHCCIKNLYITRTIIY